MHKTLEAVPIAADPARSHTSVRLGGFLAAHYAEINRSTEYLHEQFDEDSKQNDISLVYRDTPEHGIEVSLVHSGRFGAGTISSQELAEESASDHTVEIAGKLYDVRYQMTAGIYRALHTQVLLQKYQKDVLPQPTLLLGEDDTANYPSIGFLQKSGSDVEPVVSKGSPKTRYVYRPVITISNI